MESLTPDQIRSYGENGYLIVPSGLSAEDLEILKADTLELLAEEEERKASDPKYQAMTKYRRFTVGLHIRSLKIRAYVASGIFKAIGRAFIGNEVDLHFTSTITKSPGKGRSIDWHQDAVYENDGHFPRLICWTSLTESYPENGGIFAVPGSHLKGLLPHEKSALYERDLRTLGVDEAAAAPLILRAGEILIFDRHLVHGSPENKTPFDRVALISAYQKPKANYTEQELRIRMELLRG
ncbi:MAG: Phytanoyl-CoA dioxygenase [Fibrobacteres bacterium]|nr:Phytanoyl-CoA dioxygenase [Fibrobacterota bacterium]